MAATAASIGWPTGSPRRLVVQHRAACEHDRRGNGRRDAPFRPDRYLWRGAVDHRFAPGANVYVLIGGTPDADYRPEWQLGAGAAVRLHGGPYATVAQLDFRQADYPTGDVQTVTPGIEQYLGGNAWVTVQWINVWDRFRHSSGWLVRGDVMATDRLRLFAGAADAPDLDAGRGHRHVQPVRRRCRSTSAIISPCASAFAHDDPPGPADRDTLALGMGYRF